MLPTPAAAASPAFLALACVGFIASGSAFAHREPTPVDPPADKAEGDQETTQIIVTGQRTDELEGPKAVAKIVNTPRSVVVLPKEVIEQTGSATLADALRTVPGITFGAAEGGNPIGDRPFIRGFDSQGSTFIDGVRDPASQSREVFDIDQVQIVRGSDSTLGGRGSAGGSINVISKLPVARDFVSGELSFGSAGYKRITADVNRMLTDTVALRLTGVWHDQDVAGRDAIWQKRWGIAPSVTIGLGTPTRLTASFYYLESHELPDSGLPYLYVCSTTVCNAPLGTTFTTPVLGKVTTISGATATVDRSTFYGLADRDFRDTRTVQATIRAEHDFGSITLRNTTRYSYGSQEYSFLLPDDSQGNVFGTNPASPATAGGLVWRRANTRYGYDESIVNQTDLFGKFDTGSIAHSFSLGAELSWEKARRGALVTRGYLNSSGVEQLATGSTISPRCTAAAIARYYCTSLFAPNPSDPWVNYASDSSTTPSPVVHMLPIEETQNDARTIGAYAFDSITVVPRLILNLGVRYDRFTSVMTPGQTYAATSTYRLSRTDNLFNWQAGLVFKPWSDTSIYASYATAATPPNSLLGEGREDNALPTTNSAANLALLDTLKVQRTRSIEVGAKGNLLHGRLALGAALFQTDIANARVTSDVNTIDFIGKTRIRGFELTVNGDIVKGWSVFGGYTHLDPKIVDGGFTALIAPAVGAQPAQTVLVPSVNTGKQVPQTATDSLTLWTTLSPIKGLSIGGGAFYSSQVFGGYADNRAATQNAAGVVTVSSATRILSRGVPGYWRFDARIGYRIDKHWSLSVNVQNLTDAAYFSQVYTNHYATIAPGRSALATLSVKY